MSIVPLIDQQLSQFLPAPVVMIALIVIKILAIVLPLMAGVAYLTLVERKVIGYIQVRIGPNRVGPRGLGQPIADALKLLCKEAAMRPVRRLMHRLEGIAAGTASSHTAADEASAGS